MPTPREQGGRLSLRVQRLRSEPRLQLRHPVLGEGRWVLLDYGSGLVHVFLEPLRGYYDLDGLWMDATRVDVDGAAQEPSRFHSAPHRP